MRICFVGDSFVNGTGDPDFLGWTGRICGAACRENWDITYYNLGVRRDTTADIKSRWFGEVSCRLPPEVDGRIVFSFGVNDTTWENGKTRVEFNQSIKNAREILTRAKEIFPVLIVSPPPIGDRSQNLRTSQLSQEFAKICHELDIPYLEVFTTLLNSGVWMKEVVENDGAHPQASGYLELAKLVENWDGWQSWFDRSKILSQKTDETVTLFRPVGQKELDLIRKSSYLAFPPRLYFQPIFYPVVNRDYAIQIARDWNTKDAASGYVGYVTRFRVRAEFLSRYELQTVGSSQHQEYWITAEDLPEFNRNLLGKIEVIAEFKPNGVEENK